MKKIRFFFIVPYLNENTTSVNRIQSFITEAVERENIDTTILYYDFSRLNSATIGIDGNNIPLPEILKDKVFRLAPTLNIIQKLSFWLIERRFFKLYKITTAVHQLFYFSDIFTVQKISDQLQSFKFQKSDYIIALGGPFGLFKTALNIKLEYKCNLIIDYRDPWTYGYPPIDGSIVFHYFKQIIVRVQEKKILKRATLVSTVSESLKGFFPQRFKNKITVIPNAANYSTIKVNRSPEIFDIIYLGTIYDIQLEDESFFRVLNYWIKYKDKNTIRFIFLGSLNNKKLNKIILKFNLQEITLITKRLNNEEIKLYLENASLFLHLKFGNRKEIITSKQADYLKFQKPILLPFTDGGDIEESINCNNSGYVCNSELEIINVLDNAYQKFLKSEIEITNYNDASNTRGFWAKKFINMILS